MAITSRPSSSVPIVLSILTAASIAASSRTSQAGLAPVNLARLPGVVATQSSTHPSFNAGPARAIDGNLSGLWSSNSVTHTNFDVNAWWQVDLQKSHAIGVVHIVNRSDDPAATDRLFPFVLLVSDNPISSTAWTADPPADGVSRLLINSGEVSSNEAFVNVNRKGRYVLVGQMRTEPMYMNIGEVEVFEAPNAAMGRTASQSSTQGGRSADRAVDNNITDTSAGSSIAVTNSTANAYWQVDMGLSSVVREVAVWRGTDCCSANPAKQIQVYVSNVPMTGATPPAGTPVSAAVNPGSPAIVSFANVTGRYVRVQVVGTDALSIAEVQVRTFGHGGVGGHPRFSTLPSGTTDLNYAYKTINANLSDSASTSTQTDPFWEIDLGGTRILQTIRPFVASGNTTGTAWLMMSFDPFTSDTVAGTRAQPGVRSVRIRLGSGNNTIPTRNMTAQYVRIMIEGANQKLALSEVEMTATEGYIDKPRYGELNKINGSNQLTVSGFTTEKSAGVYLSSFFPDSSFGAGYLLYMGSTTSGATPTVTAFSPFPVYSFSFGTPTMIPGTFESGSLAAVRVEVSSLGGWGSDILRSLDAAGVESPSWPFARVVSTAPLPGDQIPHAYYLKRPMGTNGDGNYYTATRAAFGYDVMPDLYTNFKGKFIDGAMSKDRQASADYYNRGDLGTGRRMNCYHGSWWGNWPTQTNKRTGTVCWVENFGPANVDGVPSEWGNQTASFNLMHTAGQKGFATVVMISDDAKNLPPAFGAYNMTLNGGTGQLANNPPLNNHADNVTIQKNCVSCHGGSQSNIFCNGSDCVERDAQFLPFDKNNFEFDSTTTYNSESFRKLNQIISLARAQTQVPSVPPITPAVTNYIKGVYNNNVGGTNQTADWNWVPTDWKGDASQTKVYTEVVAKYCRGCHITQRGSRDFAEADDFELNRFSIVTEVCITKQMPHAEEAQKAFWKTGARATLIGYAGRSDMYANLCGPAWQPRFEGDEP